ncbi:MAG: polysaccharide deacetylase family protein [Pseudohongiellaceae bacterium]
MRDLSPSASRALLTLFPLGRRQRLSILIYHRVVKERDWMRPGEPTQAEFAWQMQLLQRHFTVLPLSRAVDMLRRNCLPPRAACVTFDDGYADNAIVALPVLQQYGIAATVFVAAGYLNGGRMWNDTVIEFLRQYSGDELDLSRAGLPAYPAESATLRRRAAYDIIRRCKYLERGQREEVADCIAGGTATLPDNLMLTTEQLLTLHRQGVEIGGHTFSHPILSRLHPEQAQDEIVRGKTELEGILDDPLRVFAYPNGRPGMDYNQEHVALVKEAGFEAAVTTSWGVASPRSDFFQMPRFTPWDNSSIRFLLRMALNSRHVAKASGEQSC